MKKIYISIFLFLTFIPFSKSQEVVSSTFLVSYDLDHFTDNLGIAFSTNGVDLYRVNYTTKNLEGALDTASGLICLPHIEGFNLPLVSYGHGTVGSRFDVPSYLSGEHSLPAIYSSVGTVCVAADYLGLGDNDGIHPYVHADSEAWASYDLLIAAKEFLANEMDIKLNDQLFITGYSQGGHSAMALHRYIETNTDVEVTTAMPMSGPYSISTGMKDLLVSEEEYGYVAYLVSTAISYHEVYGTIFPNDDITQFFKEPYAETIQNYIDLESDLFILNQQLLSALLLNEGGTFPKKLIFDEIVEAILNDDDHPVNVALRDNDVYDWTPKADTRLLYCQADDQVSFENSIIARDKMNENGATQVEAIDLNSDFDHGECVTPAATTFVLHLLFNATPTSVSEFPDLALNAFPNPSDGRFQIVFDDANTNYKAEIYNMAGQQRWAIDDLSSGDLIDTQLEKGMYIILLKSDDSTRPIGVERIVIF